MKKLLLLLKRKVLNKLIPLGIFLCGVLHGGRPDDEEPHVKKTLKRFGVKIDLILRVDLVRPIHLSVLIEMTLFQKSLGISEDDFDDLQSLFQVSNIFCIKLEHIDILYVYSIEISWIKCSFFFCS